MNQTMTYNHPVLIQGGMGIGVSLWPLAKAVSKLGQLGVVSGTSADTLLVRQLQDGDCGGHLRRALKYFPNQDAVRKLLDKYFKPQGRFLNEPYKLLPMYQRVLSKFQELVIMMGTFTQVFLAKEGHSGVVGMNLLTKIQMPTLPSLYGALLAGVDYILMGAGIPKEIPAALKNLIKHGEASIKLEIPGEEEVIKFNPANCIAKLNEDLKLPMFLPIVSSHTLAIMLARRCPDGIDGFIVEEFDAGGHNAPPRDGTFQSNGEPIYGERDKVDLTKLSELQKPFWLAGGTGDPEQLQEASLKGAHGVQVGTLFAFCQESGVSKDLKEKILHKISENNEMVVTDCKASPTGMPFKVFQLEDTLSEELIHKGRKRNCDLGYLRTAFRKNNGGVGFRCPGEPINTYLKKGGDIKDTEGKKCICNSLFSVIGQAQIQEGKYKEPPLITSSNQFRSLKKLIRECGRSYSAKDVINYVLG